MSKSIIKITCEWSDEDNCYIATCDGLKAHGYTIKDAMAEIFKAINLLLEMGEKIGDMLNDW